MHSDSCCTCYPFSPPNIELGSGHETSHIVTPIEDNYNCKDILNYIQFYIVDYKLWPNKVRMLLKGKLILTLVGCSCLHDAWIFLIGLFQVIGIHPCGGRYLLFPPSILILAPKNQKTTIKKTNHNSSTPLDRNPVNTNYCYNNPLNTSLLSIVMSTIL